MFCCVCFVTFIFSFFISFPVSLYFSFSLPFPYFVSLSPFLLLYVSSLFSISPSFTFIVFYLIFSTYLSLPLLCPLCVSCYVLSLYFYFSTCLSLFLFLPLFFYFFSSVFISLPSTSFSSFAIVIGQLKITSTRYYYY